MTILLAALLAFIGWGAHRGRKQQIHADRELARAIAGQHAALHERLTCAAMGLRPPRPPRFPARRESFRGERGSLDISKASGLRWALFGAGDGPKVFDEALRARRLARALGADIAAEQEFDAERRHYDAQLADARLHDAEGQGRR